MNKQINKQNRLALKNLLGKDIHRQRNYRFKTERENKRIRTEDVMDRYMRPSINFERFQRHAQGIDPWPVPEAVAGYLDTEIPLFFGDDPDFYTQLQQSLVRLNNTIAALGGAMPVGGGGGPPVGGGGVPVGGAPVGGGGGVPVGGAPVGGGGGGVPVGGAAPVGGGVPVGGGGGVGGAPVGGGPAAVVPIEGADIWAGFLDFVQVQGLTHEDARDALVATPAVVQTDPIFIILNDAVDAGRDLPEIQALVQTQLNNAAALAGGAGGAGGGLGGGGGALNLEGDIGVFLNSPAFVVGMQQHFNAAWVTLANTFNASKALVTAMNDQFFNNAGSEFERFFNDPDQTFIARGDRAAIESDVAFNNGSQWKAMHQALHQRIKACKASGLPDDRATWGLYRSTDTRVLVKAIREVSDFIFAGVMADVTRSANFKTRLRNGMAFIQQLDDNVNPLPFDDLKAAILAAAAGGL